MNDTIKKMSDENISSINYNDFAEESFKVNDDQWINFTQIKTLECNNSLNATQYQIENSTELPPSLKFDDNAKNDIVMYSVLFFIAAFGNLTVFITLFRSRYWKSRVNLMIMHLAAADLMVTFLLIPLEIGWRITTQWLAGNSACKVFQFLRAFCLYLSSMVLVCISLDRYFAILFPLKVNDAQRRGKLMLGFAWTTAAACSLPQSIIFHVDSHPEYPSFKQCVTFGFFMTQSDEMTYNLFCLSVMYFLPLVLIVAVYVRILFEISQKSKESKDFFKSIEDQRKLDASSSKQNSRLRLRRSDMTSIERARTKSLKMTVIIVLAFIWCWTPYVVMVMWYMFDRASAEKVDRRLQDVLFIMAVSNSCVNPLVYGTYNLNLKNELWRCLGRQTDQPLSRRPTASTSFRGRGSVAYQPSVSSYHSPNTKTLEDAEYSRHGENDFTRRKQTSFYKGLIEDQRESPPFHLRQGNSFISKKVPELGIPENAFGNTSVEVQFIELPSIEINSKPHKSTPKIETNHSMEHLNLPTCHTFACDDTSGLILERDLNNYKAGFLENLGPKTTAKQ